MKLIITLTAIIFLTAINIYPQAYTPGLTVYEIPFASKNNIIELELVNSESIQANALDVKIIDKPGWVKFKNTNAKIPTNEPNISYHTFNICLFEFDILKEAPVGKETSLKFAVESAGGVVGEKEIKIAVAAPVNYELYQNYPNPFNPATTISYQLPALSKVNLKIYDILGSVVKTLIEKEQSAGFHKLNWNAGRFASGMYIYQLIAENQNGEKNIFRKKMLLVK